MPSQVSVEASGSKEIIELDGCSCGAELIMIGEKIGESDGSTKNVC
jgi:hypothetical protein